MTVGGTGVATVDGRRIAYRRAGTDGPPVVLLHGTGIDDATLSWRHVVGHLADRWQVYAIDWPGYGDSEDGIEHTVENYVTVLEGFLDAVSIERASLVGISMGGAAALGYAIANPDRVDRLAVVDSYGLGRRLPSALPWKFLSNVPGATAYGKAAFNLSSAAVRSCLDTLVADASELSHEFVEEVRARAVAPGAGHAFEAFQRNELSYTGRVSTSYVDDLESLSTPTLVVHGTADPLVPVEWSVRAARRIPRAELELIERCGHWPPRERPGRFNDALTTWLSDRRRA